jgi:glycosyltransferase involved in cell wall biosynthesis
VVVTSGPPHSTHLIGKKIKALTGTRWIADFRDPWIDIYYYKELYHSKLATWYDKITERKVLVHADKIITVSEEVGKLLLRKIPGFAGKIAVIPNGYDETDFDKVTHLTNKRFTITYTGTIAVNYRIEQFIEAISRLPEGVKNELRIRFVGNVPDEILRLFELKNLSHLVEVLGYIPHERAVAEMVNASLLLLAIPDSPDNKGIVTGKFFEYLAARRPILAIGPKGGDVDRMVRECKAGQLFSYDEGDQMYQYILNLFVEVKNGTFTSQTTGAEKYTRKNLTRELIENL